MIPYPKDPIQIEVQELNDEEIKFSLTNVDASMANAIRRIMISETPIMAYEFVNVINNTSCVHDEMLAQRVGLVPLECHNVENFEFFMDCKFCQTGNSCERCSVKMRLKVTNNYQDVMEVTSKDIISDSEYVKAAKFMSVVDKGRNGEALETGILLAKLKKGQEIDIEMIARKGIGKDHAKYCPVSTAKFRYEPVIDLNKQVEQTLSSEQKKQFVQSCPTKTYELTEMDDIRVVDNMRCMFCDECLKVVEDWKIPEPYAKISMLPFKFYFHVESTGCMRPEEIVKYALGIFKKKLAVVKESCETMRNPNFITSNR